MITLSAPCFAEGTRIRTNAGDVAVEHLRAGDTVRLAAGGTAPVRWIGHRRIDCRRHPNPADVWPVRIRAGAFGGSRPQRDLVLSPDHAVFALGALVPARYLINGVTIVQDVVLFVHYFHVELPRHDVLLAENLPAESSSQHRQPPRLRLLPRARAHPAQSRDPQAGTHPPLPAPSPRLLVSPPHRNRGNSP